MSAPRWELIRDADRNDSYAEWVSTLRVRIDIVSPTYRRTSPPPGKPLPDILIFRTCFFDFTWVSVLIGVSALNSGFFFWKENNLNFG